MYLQTLKGVDDKSETDNNVSSESSESQQKSDGPANPVRTVFPWVLGGVALVLTIMLCRK